jgi:predicted Rossmann-fold nucleotide-binding protein
MGRDGRATSRHCPTSTHCCVFGGNKVEDVVATKARTTSRQILDAGAIVLSGGDGKDRHGQPLNRHGRPVEKNVKDEAHAEAQHNGRWISVLNTRYRNTRAKELKSRRFAPSGRGAVVRPQTGDQRNLLEAWMSDACIVLATGAKDGTFSELVSALCLGRPVLLIGDPNTWTNDPPWSLVCEWFESARQRQPQGGLQEAWQVDDGSAEEITERVCEYLNRREGVLGDLVHRTVIAEKLRVAEGSACLALGDDAAADAWISARLEADPVGTFPTIASNDRTVQDEFETLWTEYQTWLRELGEG